MNWIPYSFTPCWIWIVGRTWFKIIQTQGNFGNILNLISLPHAWVAIRVHLTIMNLHVWLRCWSFKGHFDILNFDPLYLMAWIGIRIHLANLIFIFFWVEMIRFRVLILNASSHLEYESMVEIIKWDFETLTMSFYSMTWIRFRNQVTTDWIPDCTSIKMIKLGLCEHLVFEFCTSCLNSWP